MGNGYTRQSSASIVNGLDITAPPLNAEFNAVQAAFNASTGHTHDGSAGEGPPIPLSTSVSGYLQDINGGVGGRNNTTATINPTASNDYSEGYSTGSVWLNTVTGRAYICVVNNSNAAIWREVVQVNESNSITPATNNTVDIGTNLFAFRSLFLSSNANVAGSLNVSGLASLSSVDINAGTIDGTVIGGSSPSTVTGTNVTANVGFSGDLTGNVTGNVSGNVTGNLAGDVTGNVTGNITSSGTSTFNNVTISGSLNMDAGTAATVTGLSAPVNDTDAATKIYVDTSISNLVDTAPGTLDTLNELAAALGDDSNFATTITNSIATKVSKSGDTMTGNLAMSGSTVTGLGTPVAGSDAATKLYVDSADATKLNLSGGTMTGNIAMGANKITSTATPTAPDDLTRKSYVDSILGSATSAADSAAAAATSETNAATSANNAATSETNAANSATAAAASFDSFDDRYLGAKSVAPSTDNDGNALLTGAIYWNTTSNSLFIWDGSTWSAAAFDSSGALIAVNNLSELTDFSQARMNLNVYSKTETYTAAEVDSQAIVFAIVLGN